MCYINVQLLLLLLLMVCVLLLEYNSISTNPQTTVLEWVWVNRNGHNTETVDLNPAQNGGKNLFSCNAATYDSSPKRGYCMPNNALFHFVLQGRWMVLYFFSYISVKMVNFLSKRSFPNYVF